MEVPPQRPPELQQQPSSPTAASSLKKQQAEEGQEADVYSMSVSSISLVDNLQALAEMRSHIFHETPELEVNRPLLSERRHQDATLVSHTRHL